MAGLEMKYFVLKPGGTDEYAAASRNAMRTYSMLISKVNPELASDLRQWIADEEYKALQEEDLNEI